MIIHGCDSVSNAANCAQASKVKGIIQLPHIVYNLTTSKLLKINEIMNTKEIIKIENNPIYGDPRAVC